MPPLDYRWAHAVNSIAKLSAVQQQIREAKKNQFALSNFVNAIEADIIWGEAQQTPVMGHPPAIDGDVPLSSFLDAMQELAMQFQSLLKQTETPLIVKLDFKSSHAFEASSELLTRFIAEFPYTKSVFINADILPGPANSNHVAFEAVNFLQQVNALGEQEGGKYRHKLVLSVGWTTANATEEEIYLTFPLRATSVRKSWPALRPLLGPPNYGFTLWWAITQIPDDEMEWLFNTLEIETHTDEATDSQSTFAGRTFYDILGFDRFLEKRGHEQSLSSAQLQS
ncbi:hypothetical protein BBO99_00007918 [Phytophthora kernoviae]|uniref:Menorin-like domain-containing protein n=2 Tax=Phytophthora kernoviae TaxID=325452 RepID=A0A3R7ILB4_9STRA|nr:hypothetical protein G195_005502 [Phytophthora kernoviae 00238/432]KAG2517129.1 hypothetical protein JM16_007533 [Phytophthora kernoviae]KAG2519656.1 hypothetical protein JM18_007491 [Phytophthora kernoviae]RLN31911.1 hypothetical protein BBI17_007859 [Phytophthora kernoviae]RLN75987.1 hypothetical protein BBO99_00007918 [Phytophthora kernoviae]